MLAGNCQAGPYLYRSGDRQGWHSLLQIYKCDLNYVKRTDQFWSLFRLILLTSKIKKQGLFNYPKVYVYSVFARIRHFVKTIWIEVLPNGSILFSTKPLVLQMVYYQLYKLWMYLIEHRHIFGRQFEAFSWCNTANGGPCKDRIYIYIKTLNYQFMYVL